MPKSALPPHLQNFDWQGTDNASWLMRQKKKIQYLLAAGPRVPSGFFKWREIPKLMFYAGGAGWPRLENTDGKVTGHQQLKNGFRWEQFNVGYHHDPKPAYLSRIQPWLRWHVSIQWPFFFNFHYFMKHKDKVKPPIYRSSFGISKLITFGFGFKRDGDKVYWLTANLGGNFE